MAFTGTPGMIDPSTGTINTTGVYGAPPIGAPDGGAAFAGQPGMIDPTTGMVSTTGFYGAPPGGGAAAAGTGAYYAGGRRAAYYLPPPPPSGPGRVVIRAERDPRALMEHRRWVPRLDGNRGFVLSQNTGWLQASTLDGLLSELSAQAAQAPASGSGTRPRLQLSYACIGCLFLMPLVLFSVMSFVGNPAMSSTTEETSSRMFILPAIMAAGFFVISFLVVCHFRWRLSKAVQEAADIEAQREAFCAAWMSRNMGCELMYRQNQTSPPYFELSPALGMP